MDTHIDTQSQQTQQTQQTQQEKQLTAIKDLQSHIPLNDFNLPTGVYRTDLLPFHNYIDPRTADAVHEEDKDSSTETETEILHRSTKELQEDQDNQDEYIPQTKPIDLARPLLPLIDEDGDDINEWDESTLGPDPLAPMLPAHIEPIAPLIPDANVTPIVQMPLEERRIAGFLEKELDQAFTPLYYEEGFPAFANGQAFWEKFDFEPMDAFQAFERYLQLGAGAVANPNDPEDGGKAATGFRSLSVLAQELHGDATILQNLDTYNIYSTLYYWGMRARAYDIFKVARHRKQQELRAIETQDEHYIMARKMMTRLMVYVDDEEEFWDLMTPKVAIEFMDKLVKIQRISSDMNATGVTPNQIDQSSQSMSLAVHLRNAANGAGNEEDGLVIDNDSQLLERALEDQGLTGDLQELIIKLNVNGG